jgi:tetratricopeptide (TPR) repeat protein
VLEGERAHELPEDTFRTLVRFHDRKGGQADLWSRLEPALKSWLEGPRRDKLLTLLDAWSTWTEKPHLPALEWRLALAVENADEAAQVRLLEQLIEVYQADEMKAEADQMRERLHELRPPAVEPVAADVSPEPVATPAQPAAAAEFDAASAVDVPVEYEAPAVPLSRADEEFVSGRMTQAEILEKYGLVTQAMDQIYEVIERFPGHLEATQHLVTLLRGTSQESALAQALVKLSLARRAAGRLEVGRQSVAEADKLGGIDPHMRAILVSLDLLPAEGAVNVEAEPQPAVAVAAPEKTKKKKSGEKRPATAKAEPAAPVAGHGDAVIDFDSFDEDEEDGSEAEVAAEPQAVPVVEAAPVEIVAEAAPVEIAAEAAPVEIAAEEPPAEKPAAAKGTESAMRFEPLPAVGDDQDDDDLRAIAAALDDDLFEDDPQGEPPASESEESLDEVFAAFRERVEQEVGAEDFRTHYDLGIGYKEMGLLDAAMAEFEISVKSEDLFQVSCVMLALCCREQAQLDQAADWYRQALEAIEDGNAGRFALRYDLAEVLVESGDTGSALDLFRDVHQHDPDFRDVAERVSQLAAAVSE